MTGTQRARPQVPAAVVEELKAIVGPSGYLESAADVAAYCRSWRDDWQGATPLVVRPQSTEEMARVVALCARSGVAIVPQGGNTGLTGAGQPNADKSEIVVSTSRMRKILAVDTVNDTMTVEAGVILKEIQSAADAADRLFPLSLGAEGSCQIGGNISTNAGGVQVLRYGNTRALVLGLEVVLPDGRVWNGLRGLRKDNAGYDLKHLFIGAEGTLGIITKAVLRVFPKPTAVETAWVAVDDPAKGVALLGHMQRHMGDALSAFELMCRQIIDFLLRGVPGHEDPMQEVHPWYVLLNVSGQGAPGSLHEPLSETLASAMELGLVRDAQIASSGAQAAKLWKMRESLAEAQLSAGGSIAHDISVPVSRIPEFITRADAALDAGFPGLRHSTFGHVGDGNMHYNVVGPAGAPWAEFKQHRPEINRIVHDLVVEFGGSISAEHGIGRTRLAELAHYKTQVDLDLMRALKQALDPAGLLNPGKVVPA